MPGERVAKFVTRVRERGEEPRAGKKPPPPRQGHLGALKDAPMERYLEQNPGMACRWEHFPVDPNMSMVPYREAQGFHVVDAKELNPGEASAQKTGPIRRGDLILMACPQEVQDALLVADAELADADYKTPETSYKEALAEKQYRTADGSAVPGSPFGKITRTSEEGSPDDFVEVNNPKAGKGGETP